MNLYDPGKPSAIQQQYIALVEEMVEQYSEGVPLPPEPGIDSVFSGIEATADSKTIDALRSLGYVK